MMELFRTPEAGQECAKIYNDIDADNPAGALVLDELFSEKRVAGSIISACGY